MVTSFQRTEPPRTAVVSALTPRKATVNPHLHQRLWTLTGKAGSVSYGVTDLQRSNFQHLLDHRKAREFQKNIYFCLVDYTKVFDYVDHNKLWKILKEIGIPNHLTCFLQNLYVGQEATEPDMEQRTGSKLGKEYIKAVYCYPASVQFSSVTQSCPTL